MADYAGLIRKKRDGGEHDLAELRELVNGYLSGAMPDYQMSAWLMAVVFRGLTLAETLALTDVEVASGEKLDLSPLGRTVVDKHSTGGVGDKVTLVLAPLIASCGAVFGKMSGRGLAHTGGTIDKLESIPGFRSELSARDFVTQLQKTGICVAGQSANLVPADKKLYELRDVTATVESNPLVAASIMGKKIASGASEVVMDLKVGRGAFLKNRGQAAGVFHLMKAIGEARGVAVRGLMTSMDQPLGYTVGNAMEVVEGIETLRGGGPPDLVNVVSRLAVMALEGSDTGLSGIEATAEVARNLNDGSALDKFKQWIAAQGGDIRYIDKPGLLPAAELVLTVTSPASGQVLTLDALEIGRAMANLGAGRHRKGDAIDPAVGLRLLRKTGDQVEAGEALAEIHANDQGLGEEAVGRVLAAYVVGDEAPVAEMRIEEL
jgi:pyrimidine-nucleoside phosphorylase